MAKKGYSSAFTFLIVISILLLILPTYYFVLVLVDKYTDFISTYNIEDNMILYRISYSQNSIFYTDKITGRTYTNIIDIERFNEKIITALLGRLRKDIGVSIVLDYNNIHKEIIINKESYSWAHSRQDIYDVVELKRIIQVRENNMLYQGNLLLGVSYKKDDK